MVTGAGKKYIFTFQNLIKMKRIFLICLCIGIASFISSCKKEKDVQSPAPAPEANLIRNLVFTNLTNVEKNISYGTSSVKITTGIENGNLFLYLNAGESTAGKSSESLTLYINESHLASGLAKGYTFGNNEPALKRIYYAYSFTELNNNTWGSITDSKLGVVFEGLLNITSHDTKNKLISGSFTVKARRLLNDPTVKSIAAPIDPANQCDLTLTGNFNNVKLP